MRAEIQVAVAREGRIALRDRGSVAGAPPASHPRRRGAASLDRRVARLAERQHGIVARWQLVELGLGPGAIDFRITGGRLHAVHRGIYAVGFRVRSSRAAWIAAVLRAGPGAVLSHPSAAALWGLRAAAGRRIEVT